MLLLWEYSVQNINWNQKVIQEIDVELLIPVENIDNDTLPNIGLYSAL